MCLTDDQIQRQDFVDNKINQLIKDLAPESTEIEWDIHLISKIRDSVEDVVINDLKLMSEQ